MNLSLLRISRPRFWIYLLGPFLVGIAATQTDPVPSIVPLVLGALYFTFPANLLIYGVNDIFDYETDKLNPKKQGYEGVLNPDQHATLWIMITLTNMPFLFAIALLVGNAIIPLIIFLFLGVFYSAKPIRAKAIPFIDTVFNGLYAVPGFVAAAMLGMQSFNPLIIAGALAWTMAMHAFSAIPDIAADTKAGVQTIATVLGRKKTVLFCTGLYLFSAAILFTIQPITSIILAIPYLAMMHFGFWAKDIFPVYKAFPIVNTIVGFLLFWAFVIERL